MFNFHFRWSEKSSWPESQPKQCSRCVLCSLSWSRRNFPHLYDWKNTQVKLFTACILFSAVLILYLRVTSNIIKFKFNFRVCFRLGFNKKCTMIFMVGRSVNELMKLIVEPCDKVSVWVHFITSGLSFITPFIHSDIQPFISACSSWLPTNVYIYCSCKRDVCGLVKVW